MNMDFMQRIFAEITKMRFYFSSLSQLPTRDNDMSHVDL